MANRVNRQTPQGKQGPTAAYYIVSFMALSAILIAAALLTYGFWLSRPINWRPETARLADTVESVLLDNYIPAANIARGEAVEEATERDGRWTRWTAQDFTVTLPAQLNAEGFKTQLRKDMSTHAVKLMNQEQDPQSSGERFSLYWEGLPFAELTLVADTANPGATYRSDLRNSSTLLADLVADVLGSLALTVPAARQEPEDREDLNALWRYTHFVAILPPGMTLGELKGRLEERNAIPNAVFSTEPDPATGADIVVGIDGKPCVGLSCTLTPAPESAQPVVPTMEDLLEGGILGSSPDESSLPGPMGVGPILPPAEAAPVPAIDGAVAPAPIEAPAPGTPARIAIIIDDGGNNSGHSDRVLALDNRLTLAILPNTPFAEETAERGAALGFEIMLHMPMETDSATEEAVPGTVYVAMGKDEIQTLTNKALDQIPGVVGVNNHTGSKFTANKKKMQIVLEVLAERDLFFVDSVTTSATVAYETAIEMGVPSARRDVFLDVETTEAYVRGQLRELIDIARERGSAVGIGHFQSAATAAVLAEEIPGFEAANIQLVHASELLE